ncbi:hypothetical protein [Micromonospora parathelypteridis]|uniref:Putative membrane protein n=1 Tax=Micromonospora parathelypteridis TaxID=1839617 RepID=A0A840VVJ0_9ACTN|nr:hypothetical protein [Micromonospora parathelypteridis]MBB5480006.1 putative membrane protein [Micromonospora parathelypteridis]GGO25464.1 hypothetical protein GCM10011576_48070 [Micromonospora parathelypteridis]
MADDTGVNKPRRRRIAWLVALAAVLVGVAVTFGVRNWDQHSGSFHVGTCFQVGDDTSIVATDGLREVSGRARVVGCETAHDAEIIRTARDVSECSADGAWLISLGQIYCVTLNKT